MVSTRHKSRRHLGIAISRSKPKRKPKSLPGAAIVTEEIQRNNPQPTFAGKDRQGFVSCGDECWHDLSALAPTVHNAFLTVAVPGIARLNLPAPKHYQTAVPNEKPVVPLDTREQIVIGRNIKVHKDGSKHTYFGLRPPVGCGFLTLKLPPDKLQQLDLPAQYSVHLVKPKICVSSDTPLLAKESITWSKQTPATQEQNIGNHSTSSRAVPESDAVLPDPLSTTGSALSKKRILSSPCFCTQDKNSTGADCFLFNSSQMAPVRDPENVQASMKDVIQVLYDMQSQVHGFVPETQSLLIEKVSELASSLSHLQSLTSKEQSPNNPIHDIRIAPEFIDYVDDGRNPDIYTRDFVELVQRGNSVMNGKQKAFRDFSEVYAKALKDGFGGGIGKDVDRVMANAGLDGNGTAALAKQTDQQNGNKIS